MHKILWENISGDQFLSGQEKTSKTRNPNSKRQIETSQAEKLVCVAEQIACTGALSYESFAIL